jgi:hypothetical protein
VPTGSPLIVTLDPPATVIVAWPFSSKLYPLYVQLTFCLPFVSVTVKLNSFVVSAGIGLTTVLLISSSPVFLVFLTATVLCVPLIVPVAFVTSVDPL